MRAQIAFQLELSYSEPARALNQVLRLTPRGFDSQHVIDWFVGVEPDARLRRSEDAFGNFVHSCSHDGPLERLVLHAEGLVEINDSAGVVHGLPERFPLDVYLRDTPDTEAGKELSAFAHDALMAETQPLGRLHRLMGLLYETIAFEPGGEAPRSAKAVFAAKKGSAREKAQVFVAAARAMKIPARFVSGFFLGDATFGGDHGWAEAYVDDLGWIGFDCALDYCPRDQHLRIANGLDYFAAAPRRGAAFGAPRETRATRLSIDMTRQAGWQTQQ